MNKELLKRIPVTVNFSNESDRRRGFLTFTERGDTIVITESIQPSEHSFYEKVPVQVHVPRGLLEALFEKPVCTHPSWETSATETWCSVCGESIPPLRVAMENAGIIVSDAEVAMWKKLHDSIGEDTYSDIFNGTQ